jgi:hypothetical protein
MPPKKAVEVSKSGTGDEAALQKEQQVRDGINIEVCHCFPQMSNELRMFYTCAYGFSTGFYIA